MHSNLRRRARSSQTDFGAQRAQRGLPDLRADRRRRSIANGRRPARQSGSLSPKRRTGQPLHAGFRFILEKTLSAERAMAGVVRTTTGFGAHANRQKGLDKDCLRYIFVMSSIGRRAKKVKTVEISTLKCAPSQLRRGGSFRKATALSRARPWPWTRWPPIRPPRFRTAAALARRARDAKGAGAAACSIAANCASSSCSSSRPSRVTATTSSARSRRAPAAPTLQAPASSIQL